MGRLKERADATMSDQRYNIRKLHDITSVSHPTFVDALTGAASVSKAFVQPLSPILAERTNHNRHEKERVHR